MNCSDVCISHDCDVDASFSSLRTVKAKKAHRCCECRAMIAAGSLYERISGKWDGEFSSDATCGTCAEIRGAFICGPWVLGMLWESIREEMFPVWRKSGEWECLAKLTTQEAVTKCNDEYRQWLTDNDGIEP